MFSPVAGSRVNATPVPDSLFKLPNTIGITLTADLKELAEQFKAEYKNQLGTDFPSDPVEQIKLAIEAVFRSWDNPRANVYRRDNDIPYSW